MSVLYVFNRSFCLKRRMSEESKETKNDFLDAGTKLHIAPNQLHYNITMFNIAVFSYIWVVVRCIRLIAYSDFSFHSLWKQNVLLWCCNWLMFVLLFKVSVLAVGGIATRLLFEERIPVSCLIRGGSEQKKKQTAFLCLLSKAGIPFQEAPPQISPPEQIFHVLPVFHASPGKRLLRPGYSPMAWQKASISVGDLSCICL